MAVYSEDAARQMVRAAIDEFAPEAFALNYDLADHPEVSGEEFRSCGKICGLLEKHGIPVERNFAGLPAAFRGAACSDSASKIKIAILAEYDALPEIGHGCGHCASGSLSVLAALALHACAGAVGANVDIIGTPDEEVRGCKIDMANAGIFDAYDFAIMIHMHAKNQATCEILALSAFRYTFHGKPAHAAAAPWEGKNALNGATLMMHAMDMMRQHVPPSTRIHGIIQHGGDANNIVPELAVADFSFRSDDSGRLARIIPLMHDCAKGAAMATQTTVEIEEYAPRMDSLKPNPTGTAMVQEIYDSLGLPHDGDRVELLGSSDIGNVSWRCPAFHPTIAIGGDFACHTREFAAVMKSEGIKKPIADGARAICEMIVRSVYEPDRLEGIRNDFRKAAE